MKLFVFYFSNQLHSSSHFRKCITLRVYDQHNPFHLKTFFCYHFNFYFHLNKLFTLNIKYFLNTSVSLLILVMVRINSFNLWNALR